MMTLPGRRKSNATPPAAEQSEDVEELDSETQPPRFGIRAVDRDRTPVEPSLKPICASSALLARTAAFFQSGNPVPSAALSSWPAQSPERSTLTPESFQPRPPSNRTRPLRRACAAASCMTGSIELLTHKPPA